MQENLSYTGKRWITPGKSVEADFLVATLSRRRGIDLRQDQESLIPPTVYPEMQTAVERIQAAIDRGETIGIFGDYDCDGITATTQLVRYFRRHDVQPLVRLPHRVHDGYGLQKKIVDSFLEQGTDLLITVDTGISAAQEVADAGKRGMDVIITDHHHPPQVLPKSVATVHPQCAPNHPAPYPSGAGVVFQLLRALEGDEWEGKDTDCALAMIGTIADIMDLRGQNRILVQKGLRSIRKLTDEPLAQLIAQAGINAPEITSTDIGFRIAPRINAAGRMSDPSLALNALLEGGEALVALEQLNVQRQDLTESLFQEALKELGLSREGKISPQTPALLSIAREDFPEGIVGLIAGKLTQMYGRPSMIGSMRAERCIASLRSVPSYHITEGLTRSKELLQSFGGHAEAAGCSLPANVFATLAEKLNQDILSQVDTADLVPTIEVDASIVPSALSLRFCESLQRLQPFGKGNSEPLFLLENIKLEEARCVGSDSSHLQGMIGRTKCIGFRLGHLFAATRDPLDIICRLGVDMWNGIRRPQLFIEDMRVAQKRTTNKQLHTTRTKLTAER